MSNTTCRQAIAISSNCIYWKRLLWVIIIIITHLAIITNENILQAAAPTSPGVRYEKAKKTLKELQSDSINQKLRKPWLKLSKVFFNIYISFPDWINRPFALYYSAVALDELSKHSLTLADAEKAIEYYQSLITEYPKRTITESALLNIAKIYMEQLHDPISARNYLQKLLTDYPKSDKIKEAQVYLKKILIDKESYSIISAQPIPETEQNSSLTSKEKHSHLSKKTFEKKIPQLENISWEEQKNYLKLIITITDPVSWSVISHPENPKTGNPIRLLVELHNTTPSPCIKPGICVRQNRLEKIRVDLSTPNRTRLLLDFSALKTFKVETKNNPFRLIIYSSSVPNGIANGMKVGQAKHSHPPTSSSKTIVAHNLAQQLGLNVKTILIDAGHGGKDPGAIHNGIIESELTLELSKRLGQMLSEKGFTIHYTRKNNTWVALEARSRKATTVKADLMISIHINANKNAQIHGVETYYLGLAKSKESTSIAQSENTTSEKTLNDLNVLLKDVMLTSKRYESRRFAESIQQNIITHLIQKNYKVHDGGTKSAPFHVLIGPNIPSILIEVGYSSNKDEARRLASNSYKKALVEGMAKGIFCYLKKLQTP